MPYLLILFAVSLTPQSGWAAKSLTDEYRGLCQAIFIGKETRRMSNSILDLKTVASIRSFIELENLSANEVDKAIQSAPTIDLDNLLLTEAVSDPITLLSLAVNAYFDDPNKVGQALRQGTNTLEPNESFNWERIISAKDMRALAARVHPGLNWDPLDRRPKDQWHELILGGIYRSKHEFGLNIFADQLIKTVGPSLAGLVGRVLNKQFPESKLPSDQPHSPEIQADNLVVASSAILYGVLSSSRMSFVDVSRFSQPAIERAQSVLKGIEIKSQLRFFQDGPTHATHLYFGESGSRFAEATNNQAADIIRRILATAKEGWSAPSFPVGEYYPEAIDLAKHLLKVNHDYHAHVSEVSERGSMNRVQFELTEIGDRAQATTDRQAKVILDDILARAQKNPRETNQHFGFRITTYKPDAIQKACDELRDQGFRIRTSENDTMTSGRWGTIEFTPATAIAQTASAEPLSPGKSKATGLSTAADQTKASRKRKDVQQPYIPARFAKALKDLESNPPVSFRLQYLTDLQIVNVVYEIIQNEDSEAAARFVDSLTQNQAIAEKVPEFIPVLNQLHKNLEDMRLGDSLLDSLMRDLL